MKSKNGFWSTLINVLLRQTLDTQRHQGCTHTRKYLHLFPYSQWAFQRPALWRLYESQFSNTKSSAERMADIQEPLTEEWQRSASHCIYVLPQHFNWKDHKLHQPRPNSGHCPLDWVSHAGNGLNSNKLLSWFRLPVSHLPSSCLRTKDSLWHYCPIRKGFKSGSLRQFRKHSGLESCMVVD